MLRGRRAGSAVHRVGRALPRADQRRRAELLIRQLARVNLRRLRRAGAFEDEDVAFEPPRALLRVLTAAGPETGFVVAKVHLAAVAVVAPAAAHLVEAREQLFGRLLIERLVHLRPVRRELHHRPVAVLHELHIQRRIRRLHAEAVAQQRISDPGADERVVVGRRRGRRIAGVFVAVRAAVIAHVMGITGRFLRVQHQRGESHAAHMLAHSRTDLKRIRSLLYR